MDWVRLPVAQPFSSGSGLPAFPPPSASVVGAVGANDNGSGVAAVLELARLFKESKPARTLRLVAFVNEEPPFFKSDQMGSRVYARRSKERTLNVAGSRSGGSSHMASPTRSLSAW